MKNELLLNDTQNDKRFENVMWEGRFQPMHKGHLSYIRLLLKLGKNVWITVNANEISTNVFKDKESIQDIEFTETVDFHHQPEKNLFPFWLRYKMAVAAIHEEFGLDAPITIMSGRRLDLAWDLYKNIFPPNRVFITPLRDEFEDAKANAWEKQGEAVYRVNVSHLPEVSGTMVREKLKSKENIEQLLMPSTIKLLTENNYL